MINGKAELDLLILVISYHSYIVEYISDLMENLETIRDTNIKVNRINDILNYKSSVALYGMLDNDEIFGSIEYKNVSYKIKGKPIIDDVNLKIEHNKITVIVGESGSGKTTLFNLLLRIIRPDNGYITIDNVDIKEYSKEAYSSNVSIINQRPFIFNMSIRKNLNFVNKDKKLQEEACKRVGIHDFIMTLPKKYDTVLIEDAKNVSGGQKQRLSIARAVASDPEIYVFDDSFSALDYKTDCKLREDLKEVTKDKTVIIVAQRINTVLNADQIITLDEGKIVGKGTHTVLMQTCETYRQIALSQLSEEELENTMQEGSEN